MDWLSLLRKAVEVEGGQAAVGRKIDYSAPTISQVLGGTYNGSTDAIRDKVLAIYGGRTLDTKPVPEGYMKNGVGNLVPIESIKEIDLVRDRFVRDVVAKAEKVSEMLTEFKQLVAGDIQAFLELSAEKYKADMGGSRGNVSLTSFDGKYKVLRAVADRLEFDERLQAAKSLIDECLREWTKDSGSEIRALIDQAFQVDKKGKINAKRIISLRQLKIEHPTWLRAMEAIGDALTVTGSRDYYRVYERDERGEYQQIPLDFSGV
ncbi:DUF3164 family protein [Thiovibrio frasassiensis]|uniref:DUF3164 family protein n=1 Tax=Thiovibrio frasassiensis TaxID=2984131 RepID=A0A9X4MDM7_9BACT|nr:DUF3164 family protein [Thiovibrio frasassiensis]MDG4475411.1 DUF3164 family protein [Thiovibrio frasassiensis]